MSDECSAAKPAPVAETSSGKLGTMNDGASAAGNTSSAAKPAPAGKTEALSELRARLECKSSLPLVAEFLVNLRMFEEWRRTKRPSNEVRNAMLKVATKFGVPRKKEGWIRKAEDVAEDLEARMLSQGRTMLTDSAEKPVAAPSNSSTAPTSAGKPDEDNINSSRAAAESLTLSELRSRLECKSSLPPVAQFLENLRIFEEWRRTNRPSNEARDAMLKVATRFGVPGKKEGRNKKWKTLPKIWNYGC